MFSIRYAFGAYASLSDSLLGIEYAYCNVFFDLHEMPGNAKMIYFYEIVVFFPLFYNHALNGISAKCASLTQSWSSSLKKSNNGILTTTEKWADKFAVHETSAEKGKAVENQIGQN